MTFPLSLMNSAAARSAICPTFTGQRSGVQTPNQSLAADTVHFSRVRFGVESSAPKRELPWPEVPDEMVAYLKAQAEAYDNGEVRWYCNEILSKCLSKEDVPLPSPEHPKYNDLLVHRIFNGAPLNDIREMYGLDVLEKDADSSFEIPGVGSISVRRNYGNEGAREMLAKAIGTLQDDDLKERWIDFMLGDPYVHVQSAVARQIATFSTQEKIDAKADELSILAQRKVSANFFGTQPNHGALSGLADSLKAVSPKLRWNLIKDLIPATRYNGDLRLTQKVESFAKTDDPNTDPTVQMLQSWLNDVQRIQGLKSLISGYSFEKAIQPYANPFTPYRENRHMETMSELGRGLQMLNNKALRESWVEDLTRLARDPEQKLSVLAKDVLIFMAFEEGPHEQIPDVTDDQQVKRWLVLADKVTANASPYAKAYFDFWKKYYSTDSEGRAMQAIRNQSTESDGPRNVWTPEKLQAFEAGLV